LEICVYLGNQREIKGVGASEFSAIETKSQLSPSIINCVFTLSYLTSKISYLFIANCKKYLYFCTPFSNRSGD